MPDIITSEKLSGFNNLFVAVSTKKFGNQSFQHPEISAEETALNRKRFFSSVGIKSGNIVGAGLCHGSVVHRTELTDRGRGSLDGNSLIPDCDAMVTRNRNVFLMVTIADCFPVFMYNPAQKSIALAHAGWRGIRENILPNTVSMLSDHLAIKATSLIVYVGPGIHSCHFKVGEDFADDFKKKFGSEIVSTNHDGLSVDLPLVIRRQLIAAGVQEDNIEISDYCTACNELLFSSFRRDRGGYIAQGAVIGMI